MYDQTCGLLLISVFELMAWMVGTNHTLVPGHLVKSSLFFLFSYLKALYVPTYYTYLYVVHILFIIKWAQVRKYTNKKTI